MAVYLIDSSKFVQNTAVKQGHIKLRNQLQTKKRRKTGFLLPFIDKNMFKTTSLSFIALKNTLISKTTFHSPAVKNNTLGKIHNY